MSVVMVGDGRFTLAELVDVLGVRVAVTVPTDRRTAAVLSGSGRAGRGWTRFGVPAAARAVALDLQSDATASARPRHHPTSGDPAAAPLMAERGVR